jgi:hypothetical protein
MQCEIEIDECENYTPCVHGTCSDRIANYFCDCEPKYGGKNCSVELTGCLDGPCLNNGTCKPYLENETNQKYNCTCPNGFHGQNCTQVCKWFLVGLNSCSVLQLKENYSWETLLPICLSLTVSTCSIPWLILLLLPLCEVVYLHSSFASNCCKAPISVHVCMSVCLSTNLCSYKNWRMLMAFY